MCAFRTPKYYPSSTPDSPAIASMGSEDIATLKLAVVSFSTCLAAYFSKQLVHSVFSVYVTSRAWTLLLLPLNWRDLSDEEVNSSEEPNNSKKGKYSSETQKHFSEISIGSLMRHCPISSKVRAVRPAHPSGWKQRTDKRGMPLNRNMLACHPLLERLKA